MRSDSHNDLYEPKSERNAKTGCFYILLGLVVIAMVVMIATDTFIW